MYVNVFEDHICHRKQLYYPRTQSFSDVFHKNVSPHFDFPTPSSMYVQIIIKIKQHTSEAAQIFVKFQKVLSLKT